MDYWSTSFVQPALDSEKGGTNDVILIEHTEIDAVTRIHFKRPLEATDDFDREILLNEQTPIIFAWQDTTDDIVYHGPSSRGTGSITIKSEDASSGGADTRPEGSLELEGGDYKVSWWVEMPSGRRRIMEDGGTVHFTVTAKGEGIQMKQCWMTRCPTVLLKEQLEVEFCFNLEATKFLDLQRLY